MKDDLRKAEQRWEQRRLFAPPPRRQRGWLLLVVAVFLGLLLWRMGDGINFLPF